MQFNVILNKVTFNSGSRRRQNATIGDDFFCTYHTPCGTDEGDCDTHDDCQVGLFCGFNNCPDYLGFHPYFDCCYSPTICTTDTPCTEGEGDCDSHDECQDGLLCGSNNCSPNSYKDCCYTPSQ